MNWNLILEVLKVVQTILKSLQDMGLRSRSTTELDLSHLIQHVNEALQHADGSSEGENAASGSPLPGSATANLGRE